MIKHTIYFIGGSARSGKTIIAAKLIQRKRVLTISTDIIRRIIRKVLFGESYVAVKKLSFKGKVTFHRPGNLKQYKLTFNKKTVMKMT